MAEVVVTMPAYRAEATLARTVADLPSGVASQIIVVDDASPDNTVRVARELGIRVVVHPENRGYGGNQKTCYVEALLAGADIVVLLHPDYQYDPKAVPLLLAPILAGDADMTFGSRFAGLGDPIHGGMPAYRFWGNRLTTVAENMMLGSRFTDMHSGLRAYTRECLKSLPFLKYSNDFVFDSQLLVDAVTSGQRVVEVPIPTRYTHESSSINIGSSLRYVGGSLSYAARRSAERGRRGRRSPVTIKKVRRAKRLRGGRTGVERACILCGAEKQRIVYDATAKGPVPIEEFACTTFALGMHDDIVQCERCGFVSAIPTITDDEILSNYAESQDPIYLTEEENRRELFNWITQSMEGFTTPGRSLVEIGSNIGLFLDVAGERGWEARGYEPSHWAVSQGHQRFGVDLRQGAIEELSEPDGSTDVAVMLDVLEHVTDPISALRRMRRLLKDEGLLVLSTIDVASRHARLRRERWPWFIRSHLWYFSAETLDAMLKLAGFKLVEWSIVPRSFRISYLAHRAGSNQGLVGEMLDKGSKIVDPKLPVGWLGDIIFVAARPTI